MNLDDGTDLMLSLVRAADGTYPLVYGTLVDAEGTRTNLDGDAFTVDVTDHWTSPATGATYPAGWRVRLPSAGLDIALHPTVAQQELDTRATTGVVYWEGSQVVSATRDGKPVGGEAYVELTGYSDERQARQHQRSDGRDRVGGAPRTDGVDDEQLEVRQVRDEQRPEQQQPVGEQQGSTVSAPPPQRGADDDRHGGDEAEEGDGQDAEERRVLGGRDRLAAVDRPAGRALAGEADDGEVRGDRQGHQRRHEERQPERPARGGIGRADGLVHRTSAVVRARHSATRRRMRRARRPVRRSQRRPRSACPAAPRS